ncbi:hypothetical protein TNCT_632021 [Trichonephila clavata]|uniref:Endonuclease/exonuclease/phosphatase domain-containing protein n=1 Tax=Trichonephila clavata TaxID=2740835 RepID=A0A8X6IMD8_TRICU|nr:hypothetical protein TNCT_632021 [Trichonephila clavata]
MHTVTRLIEMVAVLFSFKNTIKHTRIPTPDLEGAEATLVALAPEKGDSTLITSLYVHGISSKISLTNNSDKFIALGFPSNIIVGDFNAKHFSWGCDFDNGRGIKLNLCTDHDVD